MAVLKTENLTKIYTHALGAPRTPALDNLSIQVEQGEIFGFLGPNGAGKTTTIKILLKLIRASSGQAWLLDQPIQSSRLVGQIGYMPENPSFYRFLTGAEFLSFYAKLARLTGADQTQRINQLLEMVGLSHARSLRIGQYSKGMVQRIAFAQALLHDPKIILMDEPMSGLDPIGRQDMRKLILAMREQGRTVFFCSHILSDVESICDRVAILHQGKLLKTGALPELLAEKPGSYHLTISAQNQAALAGLNLPDPLACSERTGEYRYLIEDESLLQSLIPQLNGPGYYLRDLSVVRYSLEEIFVQTIQKVSQGVH